MGGVLLLIIANEQPLLFQIAWEDGSPPVWVTEMEIPDECLESYRTGLNKNKRRRSTAISQPDEHKQKKESVKKENKQRQRAPLPKKVAGNRSPSIARSSKPPEPMRRSARFKN